MKAELEWLSFVFVVMTDSKILFVSAVDICRLTAGVGVKVFPVFASYLVIYLASIFFSSRNSGTRVPKQFRFYAHSTVNVEAWLRVKKIENDAELTSYDTGYLKNFYAVQRLHEARIGLRESGERVMSIIARKQLSG